MIASIRRRGRLSSLAFVFVATAAGCVLAMIPWGTWSSLRAAPPEAGAAARPEQVTEALQDWPVPRGDSASTGGVRRDVPSDLEVRWKYQADEAIETTPVISEGIVYVGDVMGKLYAVSLDDGGELWTRDFDTGFLASAAVHRGRVFIGDVDGKFYALDAKTGRELWMVTTGGEISGSAAFAGDRVLVASQDGSLHCHRVGDGTRLWTYTTEDQIRCNPTVAAGRTFLGGCDGALHVVDIETGKAARPPLPLGGPTGSTPAAVGTRVILPIMDGAVMAFDFDSGQQQWRFEDEDRRQEYRGSGAIAGGLFIISSRNKHIDAIDLESGRRRWRHTTRRRADASPVVTGNSVWVAGTDGRLLRLGIADGKERWVHEIRGGYFAGPAIAGDRLVIADDDGVVRCFGGPADAGPGSGGSSEPK